MKKASAEWVDKAEDDWLGAKKLMREKSPLCDLVFFHCQQSAEKYLQMSKSPKIEVIVGQGLRCCSIPLFG
jgi:hypothetical protein